MRTENMKTRLGGVTILRAGAAMALVAALTACGGGGGGTPPVQEPTAAEIAAQEKAARQTTQRGAITTATNTARERVNGLDEDSTAADVAAANAAIAAIRTAIAGAADLEDSETGLNTLTADGLAAAVNMHQTEGSQRTAITDAIEAAETAVDALDPEVDDAAAETLVAQEIADLQTAINVATDLSDEQKATYTARLMGFSSSFKTHRQGDQRKAIIKERDEAKALVAALDPDSAPEDAPAAKTAVDEAEAAIAAAADIDDTSAYSAEVAMITADLETHNRKQAQRSAIRTAQTGAVAKVRALDEDSSTSDDVTEARAEIAKVRSAISDANDLAKGEIDAFEDAVALVEDEIDRIAPLVAAREKREEDDRNRVAGDRATAERLQEEFAGYRETFDKFETDSGAALTEAAELSLLVRVNGEESQASFEDRQEEAEEAGEDPDSVKRIRVDGDSDFARVNAHALLGERDAIKKALDEAADLLEKAKESEKAIMALDEGVEARKSLLELAKLVIENAEDAVSNIEDDMAEFERRNYEGALALDDDGERTPDATAQRVAEAIRDSLDLEAVTVRTIGVPSAERLGTTVGSAERRKLREEVGQTFSAIFGPGSRDVSGMRWDEIVTVTDQDDPSDENAGYGIQTSGDGTTTVVNYRGIPVSLECDSGTCTVTDGRLVGDWVVQPTDQKALYARGEDGDYMQAVFAEYAYWLTNDEVVVWAGHGDGSSGLNDAGTAFATPTGLAAADASSNTHSGDTADYSGRAGGYSVHDTDDGVIGDDDDVLASGRFTADVTLRATFGTSPVIDGVIDGFESVSGGQNVDPRWSVTLNESDFDGSNTDSHTVTTNRPGTADGSWHVRGYGGANGDQDGGSERPAGAYGAFDANFRDGAAQGAFVTERDD